MRRARTSAPYGVQACHACTHLQRSGGLPPATTTCSASKESDAAPSQQHGCIGVVERSPACETKARSVCQRFELFARDLQSGLGLTRLQSRFKQRSAWHAMPRRGASLRAALAHFLAKANAIHGKCLSGGATHPSQLVTGEQWCNCDG